MKKEMIRILKHPPIKEGRGGVLTPRDISYDKWYSEIMELVSKKLESGYLKS